MKNFFHSTIIIVSILFLTYGGFSNAQTFPIKVAIYAGAGINFPDTTDFAACLSDRNTFNYTYVLPADILAGSLKNYDVLICPGGSGSGEAASITSDGRDSIRAFVYRGGGYLGVCAGDYLASSYYSWSLHIINTNAVDAAHWARGDGDVIVDLSSAGKSFYTVSYDSFHVQYMQGMLMTPAGVDTLPPYVDLGKFASEIALNGAPPGIMIGTTAYAQSVFGMGRVFASAPHPEKTDSLHFMIVDMVKWLATKTPFTKLAAPQDSTQWVANSSRTVQWISGEGSDTMTVDYSTNGGSSWTTISSSAVGSLIWTVPNYPSTNCRMRIRSNNRSGISDISTFIITPPLPTITSVQTGSWNATSTWSGGVVPDSLHNVVISAGHTVTVNSVAKCLDLSFGDGNAKLGLNANLNIFGNFTVFADTVNPFYASASLWTTGAKMIFTGDQAEQTVYNLGTTSTSPYPIRFNELIINKSSGKFTTGTGNNYKFGIGTSLEVMNGTFELMSTDDIEGRNVSGTATTPTILVDSNGVFNMVGSSSYIRRGNFTGEETGKIGKMTIYGSAYLATSTTSKISFTNIDIQSGGILYANASRGWAANCFNPGTITVYNGGTYRNGITTNIWYTNATTPTTMVLNEGGVFVTYSSTTPFPPNITNNGTVKYAASTFNQTITDANYSRLELSNTGGFSKLWTLTADRTIADSLETNSSAILQLSSTVPTNLTVGGTINLVSGSVNNSGSNVSLILGSSASLYENSGLVNGCIKTTRTLNQGVADTLGGLGITINAAGGTPGVTTVVRTTGSCISANGSQGIKRIFHVVPTNNTSLNASVSFSYSTSDLNSIPEANLVLFQSPDSSSWSLLSSSLNQTNNILTVNGLNTLNYLTAGNSSAPLPVELDKFTSSVSSRDVILNWTTKTEINAGQFIIERSSAGSNNWITAGSLKAAGNRSTPVSYSFKDKKLNTGKYNYRLKMVDNNGRYTYSSIINSEISLPDQYSLSQNYPNPFNPSTKIDYQLPSNAIVKIEVYSITGEKVGELINKEQPAGYYTVEFGASTLNKTLSSGVYIYRIIAIDKENSGSFINTKKMIILK